jgi:hypothetical protein
MSGEGFLDVGRISADGRHGTTSRRSAKGAWTFTRCRVRVRVDSTSGAKGFVNLRAFVQTDDGRARVRVDGVVLSSVPQTVDAHAIVGMAVSHTIDIEVPISAPEGQLNTAITWVADTDG